MKKLKILILLIMTILLSGCSVKYNLTINEDESVNEEVVASESTNKMNINTGLDTDESVNYLYNMFKRKKLKSNITTLNSNGTTTSTVTASHKSVEDYAENFTSDIVPEVEYTRKDNIVSLEYLQNEILTDEGSKSLIYDNIDVNITIPFKVVSNNADEVNKNTYTWHINKYEEVKDLKLSYDKSNLKNSKIIDTGLVKFNIKYQVLVIGGVIVFALVIVLIVFINNKKNNKI